GAGGCGSADRHADRSFPRIFALGQPHGEHAVPERRADRLAVDVGRQAEAPRELAVRALDPVELLPGTALGHLPLPLDEQLVVLDPEVDVVLPQAGQLEAEDEGGPGLVHVGDRRPRADPPLVAAVRPGPGALEELVHPLLDPDDLLERIPFRLGHRPPRRWVSSWCDRRPRPRRRSPRRRPPGEPLRPGAPLLPRPPPRWSRGRRTRRSGAAPC